MSKTTTMSQKVNFYKGNKKVTDPVPSREKVLGREQVGECSPLERVLCITSSDHRCHNWHHGLECLEEFLEANNLEELPRLSSVRAYGNVRNIKNLTQLANAGKGEIEVKVLSYCLPDEFDDYLATDVKIVVHGKMWEDDGPFYRVGVLFTICLSNGEPLGYTMGALDGAVFEDTEIEDYIERGVAKTYENWFCNPSSLGSGAEIDYMYGNGPHSFAGWWIGLYSEDEALRYPNLRDVVSIAGLEDLNEYQGRQVIIGNEDDIARLEKAVARGCKATVEGEFLFCAQEFGCTMDAQPMKRVYKIKVLGRASLWDGDYPRGLASCNRDYTLYVLYGADGEPFAYVKTGVPSDEN